MSRRRKISVLSDASDASGPVRARSGLAGQWSLAKVWTSVEPVRREEVGGKPAVGREGERN